MNREKQTHARAVLEAKASVASALRMLELISVEVSDVISNVIVEGLLVTGVSKGFSDVIIIG